MSSLISHTQLGNARRLLYMSHLAIGDYLYQGVWLNALKAKYPELGIDVWFDDCRRKPHSWAAGRNRTLGEWLGAEGSFDTLYPIVGNLSERKTQIAAARDRDYDLIVFVGKNRSEQFAKVARQISSSAFIVATSSKPLGKPLAKWWYFRRLDARLSFDDYAQKYRRITKIYAAIFNAIFGLTAEDAGHQELLKIKYAADYVQKAKRFIDSFPAEDKQRALVFVNHISTGARKDYPWAQTRAVILELNKRFSNLAFIVNSPPDRFAETRTQIESDDELREVAISAFTATDSFFELPAVMAECDFSISVDTATSHLAASLSVPQVVIMANDVKLWQPPGQSIILEGSGRAASVVPTRVVEAFSRLYSG